MTPNLDSPVPVTSIRGEELFRTGPVSVGDVLNELPALRSTFSQQNSTQFLGTGGLNLLDLRGLGTNGTLVLVNGRRRVGSDVLGVPSDLIERVDLVTGGNSAVYGSDAIAGVVNFVLKTDYEGIQLRAQNGISSRGDANNFFVAGLAGTNFGDNRGNIAIAEYAQQDDIYAPDRPHTRRANAVIDTDEPGPRTDRTASRPPFAEDYRYGWYGLAAPIVLPLRGSLPVPARRFVGRADGERFPVEAYRSVFWAATATTGARAANSV